MSDKLDELGGLEVAKKEVYFLKGFDYHEAAKIIQALVERVERLERDNQEIAFENGRLKAANEKLKREFANVTDRAGVVLLNGCYHRVSDLDEICALKDENAEQRAELEKVRRFLQMATDTGHFRGEWEEMARECLKGQQ